MALAVPLQKTVQWQDEKWIYKSRGTKPPQRDRRYCSRVCLQMLKKKPPTKMSSCWSPALNFNPGAHPPTPTPGHKYEIWVATTYRPPLSALLGSFAILRKGTIRFVICLSVRLHGTTRLRPDGCSWNFVFEDFTKNLSRKFKFHSNRTRIKGTLHYDQNTFFIISRSFLLRIRNVTDKICSENQNTHFVFRNFFLKIVPFMRWCGKNIVERGRPQMTIWRMHILYWIPNATNTHTQVG